MGFSWGGGFGFPGAFFPGCVPAIFNKGFPMLILLPFSGFVFVEESFQAFL